MTATMTTVNAGLKEVYEGKIVNQLNEEQVAMKRIERTAEGVIDTVGGKYVTFPIRTQRNAGVSYRAENTQIGPAARQGYSAVQVPLKYGYGRFAFTGQVMELAETNYQAFANMADEEMDRLKGDLNKDQNRIAYGHKSGNGVLAMINDTATSATHAVVDTQYLEIGQIVDVLVVASGSATGGIQSTNVAPVTITNISGLNVTFSSSFGPATVGHGVYRFGNRILEPTGFNQIVAASGALHGLDPATVPIWAANNINNSGTPIAMTELKMITACDLARRKGGKTSVIFTSLGVRRSYFNLLTQQRRYTEMKSFPGGFQGLPFNYGTEIPLVEDPDAPVNRAWFLDESKVRVFRNKDWYFATADGDILKWVRDFDLWEGMMKMYWEVGTSQRDAHTLYDDILES